MTDMNDEIGIEFDEGIFADADVNLSDVPDDPFGFGQNFWPVRVVSVGKAKVTQGGDKIGMMVKFIVDHPNYNNHWVGDPEKGLGNGQWTQLPVPKKLQGQIPWDPKNNPKDMQALTNLKNFYKSLGYGVDEMARIHPQDIVGKGFLTKIKVTQDDNGFWQFRFNSPKPFGDGNGAEEFTRAGTSNPGGKSQAELDEEALTKELG